MYNYYGTKSLFCLIMCTAIVMKNIYTGYYESDLFFLTLSTACIPWSLGRH